MKRKLDGEELAWDEIPAFTAFVQGPREAPGLEPVQRLYDLVNDEKYLSSFKPTTEAEKLEVRDYKRLQKALGAVRKLIEKRNWRREHKNGDGVDEIDARILEIAEEALVSVGQRGSPRAGPLGDFWAGLVVPHGE